MSRTPSPTTSTVIFGPPDARSLQQLETCLTAAGSAAAAGVLCADHHPGYSMPIGGVIALRNAVMPAGVGYDIACGNCAVQTDLQAGDVPVAKIMDTLWRALSFGVGRRNDERVDHDVIDAIASSPVKPQRKLLSLAREQLGTIGSGNHYVDLFEDRADGSLWAGVHFGSRGFGHRTASGFLALAKGRAFDARVPEAGMDSAPAVLSLSQPIGQDYVAAMEIAGRYAYAGREWVVGKVLSILGARERQRVHNHHNFAWKETHHGETVWVVRKGATPAFPGQRGFIGGTMGDDAVIVRGLESPASAAALYSTVHGAGRVMSRMEARGKRRGNKVLRPGKVDWKQWQWKLKEQGIEVRGGGADEAPQCYKHLPDVLAQHQGTIEIEHTLRPVGVAMAGAQEFDPYRD
ncbi:MAG: RtcB family protein [Acidobacteriota bacterium]|nr:RtcB family protein [Acidobacteriota bacterium]